MRRLRELWVLVCVVCAASGVPPCVARTVPALRRGLLDGAPDPSTDPTDSTWSATSSSTRVHAMEDTLYTAAGVLNTAAGLATAAAHSLERLRCTDYTQALESSVARQPSPWRPGQGNDSSRSLLWALGLVTAEGELTSGGTTCAQASSGS